MFAVTYIPITVGTIASGEIKHEYPARLTVAQTVCATGTEVVALP